MRVVGVQDFGGPEVLEVFDIPEPHAGPGEVRIRVHAATVNPTDTSTRSGARAEALRAAGPPPYVPGMDAAGVIDEIGEGATTDLRVGDPVMAIVVPRGSHGGYSQHLALPAASVVRAPAGASHAEAATLPMNGLTARMALDLLALEPGQTLAVTGAAGAFGGYMVQLGKADGLTIIADASHADEALVRDLGADLVLPRGDDFAERVRDEVPGGVDGLADGAVLNELVLPAVKDGASVVTVRGWEGDAGGKVRVQPVWVREYVLEHAKLDRLRQQVEEGAVTLRVARTFPAEQASEAHRLLEAGGTRGRLVIEL